MEHEYTPNQRSGFLRKTLTPPLIVIAALLIWIEESLWVYFKNLTERFARLTWIQRYEAWLQRIPPYPTMIVFFLPGLGLLPVKMAAVWFIAQGHVGSGLAVIAGAKLIGTAIVARSFVICKPKLMTVSWFARSYEMILNIRRYFYDQVLNMPLYIEVRTLLDKMVKRRFFGATPRPGSMSYRWRAILRWLSFRKRT